MVYLAVLELKLPKDKIFEILNAYRLKLNEYNREISWSGYYLKPVHIVTKKSDNIIKVYRYFGKYWWRIEYLGLRGGKPNLKWIYVGRIKPEGLPDPPTNPLEGFVFFTIAGDDEHIYVSQKVYKKFEKILEK